MLSRRIRRLRASRDVEALVELLSGGNRRDRRAAARALGELGDARAVEPLIAALPNTYGEDEDLAPIIVGALGNLRDPRAAEPLTMLLADRRDDSFYLFSHREALFALADLEVLEPLREVAGDDSRDRMLRQEAEGLLRKASA